MESRIVHVVVSVVFLVEAVSSGVTDVSNSLLSILSNLLIEVVVSCIVDVVSSEASSIFTKSG